MKFKLVFSGNGWKRDSNLERVIAALNSEEFDRKIAGLFFQHIPDAMLMGPAEFYRQNDDFGRHPSMPDALGIVICISQAYRKKGRDWKSLGADLVELVVSLLMQCFHGGMFHNDDEITVFFEGHLSDVDGRSEFEESGPITVKSA